jgi:hypothetical protein
MIAATFRGEVAVGQLSLLVLENPWTDSVADDISVAPFVQGFEKWAANLTTYVRQFYRLDELQMWLADFARRRPGVRRRVVYLASHGTPGRFGGLPDGSGQTNFRNLCRVVKSVGGFEGLHLGCCNLGSRANADGLLRPDRRRRKAVPCKWVAGYREDNIGWLDSMVVDLVFWSFLLADKKHDAWSAALKTYTFTPRARKLGFAVFRNGPGGRLLDSLEVVGGSHDKEE